MGEFQPVLNTVLAAGLVGMVTWVWALWKAHNDLRIKIAEDHPKGEAMKEIVRAAIAPLQKQVDALEQANDRNGKILAAIAGRLQVPAALGD